MVRISTRQAPGRLARVGTTPAFEWRAPVMMGISKRGSQHLRTLLVHGARAVVRTAVRKTDSRSIWVNQLRQRRGYNRATVAIANKNARIVWAVLTSGEPYRSAA